MSRGTAITSLLVGVLPALAACETYRIEYHERPAFYRAAGVGDGRVTLEDGTVLVFTTREPASPVERLANDEREPFRIREEMEDGTVVLRSLLPQHVLANTLTCIRNEEYELLWEQVVSERTRRNYELRGQGYEEFERFFKSNRLELAATLTRLLLGLPRGDSFMETIEGGAVRFYFHPRVATEFRFKTAEVISEAGSLKLLMIK